MTILRHLKRAVFRWSGSIRWLRFNRWFWLNHWLGYIQKWITVHWLGFLHRSGVDNTTLLELDDGIKVSLRNLAKDQQCSEEELISDLIYNALSQRMVEIEAGMDLLSRWETLTPREQQVTLLVCRGFTNPQIALRLGLSPYTVKVHVRQTLGKLGFRSKQELRNTLFGWDFRL